MQIVSTHRKLSFWIGGLLSFPAAYFIVISVLKYGLGFPAGYDATAPLLESMGISEPLGWNINLLIVFGPLLALLANFFIVVSIRWKDEKEKLQLYFHINKHWLNISMAAISFMVLLVLFIICWVKTAGMEAILKCSTLFYFFDH